MERSQVDSPADFTADHRTMMYAADQLNGGGDFVDADAGKGEYGMPEITKDPRMATIMDQGASPDTRELVEELAKDYGLEDLAERVYTHAVLNNFDADRQEVIRREADVAGTLIMMALASARGDEKNTLTSYEDRIRVITGKDPEIVDPNGPEAEELRERFMELLARKGFHVTNGKTRDGVVEEWEHSLGAHDTSDFEAFQETLTGMGRDYMELLKSEVLAKVDPSLAELPLDGLAYVGERDMNFDAFLAYDGDFKGRFRWNMSRPAPTEDVRYITAHESTHFAQAVVQDHLRRQGRLGSEAAFTTMSSGMAVQTEGLAQVAPQLVSGGTLEGVVNRFGIDYAAMVAQDGLQDLTREYVGQQVALNGRDVRDLAPVIQTRFLQNPHIVEKYVRAKNKPDGTRAKKSYWAENDVGQMYGPSYRHGSRGFKEMIAEHGVLPVARAAFFLDGFTDLPGMQAKLARKTA